MSRTLSGNLTGKAAQIAMRELREEISEEIERQSEECETMYRYLAQEMTDDEYHAWLDTTPNDDRGFFRAVKAKYDELNSSVLINRQNTILAIFKGERLNAQQSDEYIMELAEIETALQKGGIQ